MWKAKQDTDQSVDKENAPQGLIRAVSAEGATSSPLREKNKFVRAKTLQHVPYIPSPDKHEKSPEDVDTSIKSLDMDSFVEQKPEICSREHAKATPIDVSVPHIEPDIPPRSVTALDPVSGPDKHEKPQNVVTSIKSLDTDSIANVSVPQVESDTPLISVTAAAAAPVLVSSPLSKLQPVVPQCQSPEPTTHLAADGFTTPKATTPVRPEIYSPQTQVGIAQKEIDITNVGRSLADMLNSDAAENEDETPSDEAVITEVSVEKAAEETINPIHESSLGGDASTILNDQDETTEISEEQESANEASPMLIATCDKVDNDPTSEETNEVEKIHESSKSDSTLQGAADIKTKTVSFEPESTKDEKNASKSTNEPAFSRMKSSEFEGLQAGFLLRKKRGRRRRSSAESESSVTSDPARSEACDVTAAVARVTEEDREIVLQESRVKDGEFAKQVSGKNETEKESPSRVEDDDVLEISRVIDDAQEELDAMCARPSDDGDKEVLVLLCLHSVSLNFISWNENVSNKIHCLLMVTYDKVVRCVRESACVLRSTGEDATCAQSFSSDGVAVFALFLLFTKSRFPLL